MRPSTSTMWEPTRPAPTTTTWSRSVGAIEASRCGRAPTCGPIVALQPRHQLEEQRVDGDGEEGGGQDERILVVGQHVQPYRRLTQDERELADLGEAGGDDERRERGLAQHEGEGQGDQALAQDDERGEEGDVARVGDQVARVDEHAHRHEEEDGEGLAEGQHVRADLMAQRRLGDDDAGQEGAERDRHAEQRGRGEGDAEGHREGDEQEQLARLHAGDLQQHPGHDARAQQQHERDEHGGLEEGETEGRRVDAGRARGKGGQHQQEQHRGQVLEHQPADGDAAVPAVEEPLVHEAAQEDDGAGDGDGEPEHDAGLARPAPPPADAVAERGGDGHLADGAGYGDRAHPPEVVEREMQADAEHQEDHAQLGQLADRVDVAHGSRG